MTLAAKTTSTIVPCLRYRNALQMIDWLCNAFDFEKHAVYATARPSITPNWCSATAC